MRPYRATAPRINRRLSLLTPLLLGGLPLAAGAQITNTWVGTGGNANWSTAANWNPSGKPTSGASTGLDFTGSSATSSNDLGAFQLNLIQFDMAANLSLSGNALNFVSNGGVTPVLNQDKTFTVSISNNLTLTNNLNINQTGSGTITLSGVISGAGSLTLSATNAGYTTVLSNAGNSFGGGTVIAGGLLQLGANNALPSGKDLQLAGTLAGSALDLKGHNVTVGNITFADGSASATNTMAINDTSSGSVGTLTLKGYITYNPGNDSGGNVVTPTAYINSSLSLASGQHVIDNSGNGNFSVQNYDVILHGPVSGAGGLDIGSVNDASTGIYAVLAQTNTYTGPTNVVNGSLYLGAANALPVNGAVTVGAGGNLFLYIASDYTETGLKPGSYNQSIGSLADGSLGGGIINLGGATLTVGGDNTSTTFSGIIQDNDGNTIDPSAVGGSLIKVGTGTLTLSGQNAYTGSTTINAGTLQLGTTDALPNGTAALSGLASDLILNGGAFDTNANSQTLNKVTNQGGTVLVQGGGSVVTVNGAYTQSAGVTQIDDTLNLTPGQDMKITGGQLVGTGTIGNATTSGTVTVTNAGGTLRPGDLLAAPTVGTLTVNGNYTQQAGGKLEIDLSSATQYSVLSVLNAASLGGELDVKLVNGFMPIPGEPFNFLTYGSRTGDFASILGLDPGYAYTVSYNDSTGVGTLMVASVGVPEGSTLISALLVLATGGLLLRRRQGAASPSPA